MRRIALVLVLVAGTLAGGAAAAQTVGGPYSVEGSNPNGSHYGGSAEIIPLPDHTCRITWQVGTTWNGVCLLSGHAFAAVYQSGGTSGLAVYELQSDGALHGTWTLGGKTGTEVLTPAK